MGSVKQIPMMDFSRSRPANLELIMQSLVKMGQRGALLESGASYHFYGFTVWTTRCGVLSRAVIIVEFSIQDGST